MSAGVISATPVEYATGLAEGVITPTIVGGSLVGPFPDSPTNHVDPNTTTSLFGGVGSFRVNGGVLGTFIGSGAAISSTRILTAAHLFDLNNDGISDVTPGSVTFNLNFGSSLSSSITASSIVIHPNYTGFNHPVVNDDLAVVTLTSALPTGVPIYALSANPFIFVQEITMVGYGRSGDGNGGYTTGAAFDVKRVGKNKAEVVGFDDEGSGGKEVFYWDFDGPTNATSFFGGTTLGNTIESAIAPGDSGGPSFISVGGNLELFGVNTFTGTPAGKTPGTFGTYGGGMLVSGYKSWIESVSVPDSVTTAGLVGFVFVCLVAVGTRRKQV